MKRLNVKLQKYMYLPILIILLFIFSFCVSTPKEIVSGYIKILLSPSILITDYLAISNLGATLFNVATIMLFNLYFVRKFELRLSGPIFSGFLIIAGFSFFGKNIFNTIPIYFGIYLYSKMKKTPFKNYIISILFSTGISPLVSYCIFGFGLELYIGIPLGIICGTIAGFLVPAFASHTMKFHQGYNLYNTGFALGVISVIFYAIFMSFDLKVNTVLIINEKYHFYLLGMILFLSISSIIISLINNFTVFKKYRSLMRRSGRLVSDFIRDFGTKTVLFNFGIIGLICVLIVIVFKIKIDGPTVGTILSVMGMGAYGLHIRNMIPVLIGSIIAVFLKGANMTDETIVLAVLFSTGLAPLAGKYGIIVGVISGIIHIIVAPLMISFQGGFDLYNNGFVAGFVASIVSVMADSILKGDELS